MPKDYESFKSFAELSGPQQGGGGRGHSGHSQSQPGGRSSQSSGGRGGGFGPDPLQGYLAGGYFEPSGHLRKEIFIDWAKSMTDALAQAKPKATKNSLRAFYSMLRMAKNQFDAQKADREAAWGDAKAQLYRLRTAAQYQGTRGVISRLCQEKFLNDNIDLVLKEGTNLDQFTKYFNAFVEHFQSVIAYLPERAER
jgi:CRISPR type III-A-associated protein Csm2